MGRRSRSLWDDHSHRTDETSRVCKKPKSPSFLEHFLPFCSCPTCAQGLPCQAVTANHLHIHLGPQTSNSRLLLSSKMHHGVWNTGDPNGPSKSVPLLHCVAFYSSSAVPRPFLLPIKWDYWSKGRGPPPGVGLGQGRVSKMDICVSDSVSGSVRAIPLCSPLASAVQFLSKSLAIPEVTSRLTHEA